MMPIVLEWDQIALRLVLTVLAGGLVGLDRERHGRPVGLRTTLLVCLAASISMIQANLLLPTNGKTDASFATLDLMRLPLGILTGMGFIGAGAILKKDDIVVGVTTAATLWLVTVLGLCFGGGQIALGITALVIGMVILEACKRLEPFLQEQRIAFLTVSGVEPGVTEDAVRAALLAQGLHPDSTTVRYEADSQRWTMHWHVRWRARPIDAPSPTIIKELAQQPGICSVEWRPVGRAVDSRA
jgi:putative Mg2+ transporter-C (MgtC) family protein